MYRTTALRVLGAMVCLLLATTTFSQRIYVKAGGNGDGSSWAQAAGDLARVMATAKPGAEIWVAKGTYTPGNNRYDVFLLRNGVAVYGGFAGHETTLAERDVYRNITVLSGEIGTPSPEDNTYNVVHVTGWSDATRLDGFVIRGGHANGSGAPGARQRGGGGLYLEASDAGTMEVQIVNCTLENNYGKDGGAVYVASSHGRKANPAFVGCIFRDNRADLDGGAMHIDARMGGQSQPQLWHCTFENNLGNYGGAIFANGFNGHAEPTLRYCTFTHNSAYVRGGAIYHMDSKGFASSSVEDCQFVDTKDAYGTEHIYTYSKQRNAAESLFSRL